MVNKKNIVAQRGFTLVELSIVLVIIGLLIGGVLVAQSMIGAAKSQKFIRQLATYDTAVENFKTKYGQLPGDNTFFGNVGVVVDGRILDTGQGADFYSGEIGRFWSDLSQAGGIKSEDGKAFADASAGTQGIQPGINIPKTAIGATGSVLLPFCPGFGTSLGAGINDYEAAVLTGGAGSAEVEAAAFTTPEALAIDTKIDDAKGGTGNIIGGDGTAGSCLSSGNYLIGSSGVRCVLSIRMGTSSGVLE